MTDAGRNSQELGGQFLRALDKTCVGVAASKLFAASMGNVAVVLLRSTAHEHYSHILVHLRLVRAR
jgi:hypothetical protein